VHCLGRPKEAFRSHGSTEYRSEHIRPQDFGRSGQQVPDLERAAAPAHLRQRAVAPERVIPDSLIVAHDRTLPKLPELRAAIFCKEGFDLKRNKALVEAFVAAVQPSYATPKWAARRA